MDKNLAAFLAITEAKNLTIAAERIGLSQPSLTKRLANLEDELGSQLFERHRRGMILTSAGERFYRRACRIEQEYLQAREELVSLQNAGLDTLHIGAGPLFHQRHIAPVFAKLREQYPTLRMELVVESNERNLPMLQRGELDIVLGVIQQTEPNGALLTKPMTNLQHGLVMQRNSPKFIPEMLHPEALKEFKWVLYSVDRDTENLLNSYLMKHNLGKPDIAVRTDSFATGLGLVREAGFVMMAPTQLAPIIDSDVLKVVPTNPPISNLHSGAYVRPSSMGFPAVRSFIELMTEQFQIGDL